MRRPMAIAGIAVLALVLAGCDWVLGETIGYVSWTEQQRDAAGAPRARWDAQLAHCADDWAGDLAAGGGRLVHADLSTCWPAGATALGENLSAGPNAFSALQAIVDSPAHMTVMNDAKWTRFGVGVSQTSNGNWIFVWRFANG